MFDLLPTLPLLSAFLLASFVVAVTPGPGVVYIVTRTVTEGRACGLASAAGVALGNFGNALGASLGLAAIFSASSLAFEVVRYAGALYLLFLGWKAIRTEGTPAMPASNSTRKAASRALRDGFFIALFNPKTALFFAAFLPQFVVPAASNALQPIILASLFVLIAAVTDALYATFASLAATWFCRVRFAASAARYATGGAYLGLGLFTAFSGTRAKQ
jgi:threonine/homoserine/homoserine lactone efflux protein